MVNMVNKYGDMGMFTTFAIDCGWCMYYEDSLKDLIDDYTMYTSIQKKSVHVLRANVNGDTIN
jgi:hypothetical protein